MANQPISQFSSGVCKKIPADRRMITFENAIWILQNPAIRLNRIERIEVTCILQNYRDLNKSRVCAHGRKYDEVCEGCLAEKMLQEAKKCK